MPEISESYQKANELKATLFKIMSQLIFVCEHFWEQNPKCGPTIDLELFYTKLGKIVGSGNVYWFVRTGLTERDALKLEAMSMMRQISFMSVDIWPGAQDDGRQLWQIQENLRTADRMYLDLVRLGYKMNRPHLTVGDVVKPDCLPGGKNILGDEELKIFEVGDIPNEDLLRCGTDQFIYCYRRRGDQREYLMLEGEEAVWRVLKREPNREETVPTTAMFVKLVGRRFSPRKATQ